MLAEFEKRFTSAGLRICAFNYVGNCLHPIEEIAKIHDEAFRNVLTVAGKLNVPTLVSLAGCPGGSPTDVTPNWITCSSTEDFPRALDWQWSERVIPYWKEMADYAKDCGVRVAIEMHP
jgi:sugar phosphate isomerase/epimerase